MVMLPTDMMGVVQARLDRGERGRLEDGNDDGECGPSPSDPREGL